MVGGLSSPGQTIHRAATPRSHGPYWNWLDFVHFPEPLGTRMRIEEGEAIYTAVREALNKGARP